MTYTMDTTVKAKLDYDENKVNEVISKCGIKLLNNVGDWQKFFITNLKLDNGIEIYTKLDYDQEENRYYIAVYSKSGGSWKYVSKLDFYLELLDKELGSTYKIYTDKETGFNFTEEELIKNCRSLFLGYNVPKGVNYKRMIKKYSGYNKIIKTIMDNDFNDIQKAADDEHKEEPKDGYQPEGSYKPQQIYEEFRQKKTDAEAVKIEEKKEAINHLVEVATKFEIPGDIAEDVNKNKLNSDNSKTKLSNIKEIKEYCQWTTHKYADKSNVNKIMFLDRNSLSSGSGMQIFVLLDPETHKPLNSENFEKSTEVSLGLIRFGHILYYTDEKFNLDDPFVFKTMREHMFKEKIIWPREESYFTIYDKKTHEITIKVVNPQEMFGEDYETRLSYKEQLSKIAEDLGENEVILLNHAGMQLTYTTEIPGIGPDKGIDVSFLKDISHDLFGISKKDIEEDKAPQPIERDEFFNQAVKNLNKKDEDFLFEMFNYNKTGKQDLFCIYYDQENNRFYLDKYIDIRDGTIPNNLRNYLCLMGYSKETIFTMPNFYISYFSSLHELIELLSNESKWFDSALLRLEIKCTYDDHDLIMQLKDNLINNIKIYMRELLKSDRQNKKKREEIEDDEFLENEEENFCVSRTNFSSKGSLIYYMEQFVQDELNFYSSETVEQFYKVLCLWYMQYLLNKDKDFKNDIGIKIDKSSALINNFLMNIDKSSELINIFHMKKIIAKWNVGEEINKDELSLLKEYFKTNISKINVELSEGYETRLGVDKNTKIFTSERKFINFDKFLLLYDNLNDEEALINVIQLSVKFFNNTLTDEEYRTYVEKLLSQPQSVEDRYIEEHFLKDYNPNNYFRRDPDTAIAEYKKIYKKLKNKYVEYIVEQYKKDKSKAFSFSAENLSQYICAKVNYNLEMGDIEQKMAYGHNGSLVKKSIIFEDFKEKYFIYLGIRTYIEQHYKKDSPDKLLTEIQKKLGDEAEQKKLKEVGQKIYSQYTISEKNAFIRIFQNTYDNLYKEGAFKNPISFLIPDIIQKIFPFTDGNILMKVMSACKDENSSDHSLQNYIKLYVNHLKNKFILNFRVLDEEDFLNIDEDPLYTDQDPYYKIMFARQLSIYQSYIYDNRDIAKNLELLSSNLFKDQFLKTYAIYSNDLANLLFSLSLLYNDYDNTKSIIIQNDNVEHLNLGDEELEKIKYISMEIAEGEKDEFLFFISLLLPEMNDCCDKKIMYLLFIQLYRSLYESNGINKIFLERLKNVYKIFSQQMQNDTLFHLGFLEESMYSSKNGNSCPLATLAINMLFGIDRDNIITNKTIVSNLLEFINIKTDIHSDIINFMTLITSDDDSMEDISDFWRHNSFCIYGREMFLEDFQLSNNIGEDMNTTMSSDIQNSTDESVEITKEYVENKIKEVFGNKCKISWNQSKFKSNPGEYPTIKLTHNGKMYNFTLRDADRKDRLITINKLQDDATINMHIYCNTNKILVSNKQFTLSNMNEIKTDIENYFNSKICTFDSTPIILYYDSDNKKINFLKRPFNKDCNTMSDAISSIYSSFNAENNAYVLLQNIDNTNYTIFNFNKVIFSEIKSCNYMIPYKFFNGSFAILNKPNAKPTIIDNPKDIDIINRQMMHLKDTLLDLDKKLLKEDHLEYGEEYIIIYDTVKKYITLKPKNYTMTATEYVLKDDKDNSIIIHDQVPYFLDIYQYLQNNEDTKWVDLNNNLLSKEYEKSIGESIDDFITKVYDQRQLNDLISMEENTEQLQQHLQELQKSQEQTHDTSTDTDIEINTELDELLNYIDRDCFQFRQYETPELDYIFNRELSIAKSCTIMRTCPVSYLLKMVKNYTDGYRFHSSQLWGMLDCDKRDQVIVSYDDQSVFSNKMPISILNQLYFIFLATEYSLCSDNVCQNENLSIEFTFTNGKLTGEEQRLIEEWNQGSLISKENFRKLINLFALNKIKVKNIEKELLQVQNTLGEGGEKKIFDDYKNLSDLLQKFLFFRDNYSFKDLKDEDIQKKVISIILLYRSVLSQEKMTAQVYKTLLENIFDIDISTFIKNDCEQYKEEYDKLKANYIGYLVKQYEKDPEKAMGFSVLYLQNYIKYKIDYQKEIEQLKTNGHYDEFCKFETEYILSLGIREYIRQNGYIDSNRSAEEIFKEINSILNATESDKDLYNIKQNLINMGQIIYNKYDPQEKCIFLKFYKKIIDVSDSKVDSKSCLTSKSLLMFDSWVSIMNSPYIDTQLKQFFLTDGQTKEQLELMILEEYLQYNRIPQNLIYKRSIMERRNFDLSDACKVQSFCFKKLYTSSRVLMSDDDINLIAARYSEIINNTCYNANYFFSDNLFKLLCCDQDIISKNEYDTNSQLGQNQASYKLLENDEQQYIQNILQNLATGQDKEFIFFLSCISNYMYSIETNLSTYFYEGEGKINYYKMLVNLHKSLYSPKNQAFLDRLKNVYKIFSQKNSNDELYRLDIHDDSHPDNDDVLSEIIRQNLLLYSSKSATKKIINDKATYFQSIVNILVRSNAQEDIVDVMATFLYSNNTVYTDILTQTTMLTTTAEQFEQLKSSENREKYLQELQKSEYYIPPALGANYTKKIFELQDILPTKFNKKGEEMKEEIQNSIKKLQEQNSEIEQAKLQLQEQIHKKDEENKENEKRMLAAQMQSNQVEMASNQLSQDLISLNSQIAEKEKELEGLLADNSDYETELTEKQKQKEEMEKIGEELQQRIQELQKNQEQTHDASADTDIKINTELNTELGGLLNYIDREYYQYRRYKNPALDLIGNMFHSNYMNGFKETFFKYYSGDITSFSCHDTKFNFRKFDSCNFSKKIQIIYGYILYVKYLEKNYKKNDDQIIFKISDVDNEEIKTIATKWNDGNELTEDEYVTLLQNYIDNKIEIEQSTKIINKFQEIYKLLENDYKKHGQNVRKYLCFVHGFPKLEINGIEYMNISPIVNLVSDVENKTLTAEKYKTYLEKILVLNEKKSAKYTKLFNEVKNTYIEYLVAQYKKDSEKVYEFSVRGLFNYVEYKLKYQELYDFLTNEKIDEKINTNNDDIADLLGYSYLYNIHKNANADISYNKGYVAEKDQARQGKFVSGDRKELIITDIRNEFKNFENDYILSLGIREYIRQNGYIDSDRSAEEIFKEINSILNATESDKNLYSIKQSLRDMGQKIYDKYDIQEKYIFIECFKEKYYIFRGNKCLHKTPISLLMLNYNTYYYHGGSDGQEDKNATFLSVTNLREEKNGVKRSDKNKRQYIFDIESSEDVDLRYFTAYLEYNRLPTTQTYKNYLEFYDKGFPAPYKSIKSYYFSKLYMLTTEDYKDTKTYSESYGVKDPQDSMEKIFSEINKEYNEIFTNTCYLPSSDFANHIFYLLLFNKMDRINEGQILSSLSKQYKKLNEDNTKKMQEILDNLKQGKNKEFVFLFSLLSNEAQIQGIINDNMFYFYTITLYNSLYHEKNAKFLERLKNIYKIYSQKTVPDELYQLTKIDLSSAGYNKDIRKYKFINTNLFSMYYSEVIKEVAEHVRDMYDAYKENPSKGNDIIDIFQIISNIFQIISEEERENSEESSEETEESSEETEEIKSFYEGETYFFPESGTNAEIKSSEFFNETYDDTEDLTSTAEIEAIKGELRQIETEEKKYDDEIKELQKKSDKKKQLSQELEELKKSLTEKESQNKTQQETIKNYNVSINSLKQQQQKIQGEIAILRQEIEEQDEQLQSNQSQILLFEKQLSDLEMSLSSSSIPSTPSTSSVPTSTVPPKEEPKIELPEPPSSGEATGNTKLTIKNQKIAPDEMEKLLNEFTELTSEKYILQIIALEGGNCTIQIISTTNLGKYNNKKVDGYFIEDKNGPGTARTPKSFDDIQGAINYLKNNINKPLDIIQTNSKERKITFEGQITPTQITVSVPGLENDIQMPSDESKPDVKVCAIINPFSGKITYQLYNQGEKEPDYPYILRNKEGKIIYKKSVTDFYNFLNDELGKDEAIYLQINEELYKLEVNTKDNGQLYIKDINKIIDRKKAKREINKYINTKLLSNDNNFMNYIDIIDDDIYLENATSMSDDEEEELKQYVQDSLEASTLENFSPNAKYELTFNGRTFTTSLAEKRGLCNTKFWQTINDEFDGFKFSEESLFYNNSTKEIKVKIGDTEYFVCQQEDKTSKYQKIIYTDDKFDKIGMLNYIYKNSPKIALIPTDVWNSASTTTDKLYTFDNQYKGKYIVVVNPSSSNSIQIDKDNTHNIGISTLNKIKLDLFDEQINPRYPHDSEILQQYRKNLQYVNYWINGFQLIINKDVDFITPNFYKQYYNSELVYDENINVDPLNIFDQCLKQLATSSKINYEVINKDEDFKKFIKDNCGVIENRIQKPDTRQLCYCDLDVAINKQYFISKYLSVICNQYFSIGENPDIKKEYLKRVSTIFKSEQSLNEEYFEQNYVFKSDIQKYLTSNHITNYNLNDRTQRVLLFIIFNNLSTKTIDENTGEIQFNFQDKNINEILKTCSHKDIDKNLKNMRDIVNFCKQNYINFSEISKFLMLEYNIDFISKHLSLLKNISSLEQELYKNFINQQSQQNIYCLKQDLKYYAKYDSLNLNMTMELYSTSQENEIKNADNRVLVDTKETIKSADTISDFCGNYTKDYSTKSKTTCYYWNSKKLKSEDVEKIKIKLPGLDTIIISRASNKIPDIKYYAIIDYSSNNLVFHPFIGNDITNNFSCEQIICSDNKPIIAQSPAELIKTMASAKNLYTAELENSKIKDTTKQEFTMIQEGDAYRLSSRSIDVQYNISNKLKFDDENIKTNFIHDSKTGRTTIKIEYNDTKQNIKFEAIVCDENGNEITYNEFDENKQMYLKINDKVIKYNKEDSTTQYSKHFESLILLYSNFESAKQKYINNIQTKYKREEFNGITSEEKKTAQKKLLEEFDNFKNKVLFDDFSTKQKLINELIKKTSKRILYEILVHYIDKETITNDDIKKADDDNASPEISQAVLNRIIKYNNNCIKRYINIDSSLKFMNNCNTKETTNRYYLHDCTKMDESKVIIPYNTTIIKAYEKAFDSIKVDHNTLTISNVPDKMDTTNKDYFIAMLNIVYNHLHHNNIEKIKLCSDKNNQEITIDIGKNNKITIFRQILLPIINDDACNDVFSAIENNKRTFIADSTLKNINNIIIDKCNSMLISKAEYHKDNDNKISMEIYDYTKGDKSFDVYFKDLKGNFLNIDNFLDTKGQIKVVDKNGKELYELNVDEASNPAESLSNTLLSKEKNRIIVDYSNNIYLSYISHYFEGEKQNYYQAYLNSLGIQLENVIPNEIQEVIDNKKQIENMICQQLYQKYDDISYKDPYQILSNFNMDTFLNNYDIEVLNRIYLNNNKINTQQERIEIEKNKYEYTFLEKSNKRFYIFNSSIDENQQKSIYNKIIEDKKEGIYLIPYSINNNHWVMQYIEINDKGTITNQGKIDSNDRFYYRPKLRQQGLTCGLWTSWAIMNSIEYGPQNLQNILTNPNMPLPKSCSQERMLEMHERIDKIMLFCSLDNKEVEIGDKQYNLKFNPKVIQDDEKNEKNEKYEYKYLLTNKEDSEDLRELILDYDKNTHKISKMTYIVDKQRYEIQTNLDISNDSYNNTSSLILQNRLLNNLITLNNKYLSNEDNQNNSKEDTKPKIEEEKPAEQSKEEEPKEEKPTPKSQKPETEDIMENIDTDLKDFLEYLDKTHIHSDKYSTSVLNRFNSHGYDIWHYKYLDDSFVNYFDQDKFEDDYGLKGEVVKDNAADYLRIIVQQIITQRFTSHQISKRCDLSSYLIYGSLFKDILEQIKQPIKDNIEKNGLLYFDDEFTFKIQNNKDLKIIYDNDKELSYQENQLFNKWNTAIDNAGATDKEINIQLSFEELKTLIFDVYNQDRNIHLQKKVNFENALTSKFGYPEQYKDFFSTYCMHNDNMRVKFLSFFGTTINENDLERPIQQQYIQLVEDTVFGNLTEDKYRNFLNNYFKSGEKSYNTKYINGHIEEKFETYVPKDQYIKNYDELKDKYINFLVDRFKKEPLRALEFSRGCLKEYASYKCLYDKDKDDIENDSYKKENFKFFKDNYILSLGIQQYMNQNNLKNSTDTYFVMEKIDNVLKTDEEQIRKLGEEVYNSYSVREKLGVEFLFNKLFYMSVSKNMEHNNKLFDNQLKTIKNKINPQSLLLLDMFKSTLDEPNTEIIIDSIIKSMFWEDNEKINGPDILNRVALDCYLKTKNDYLFSFCSGLSGDFSVGNYDFCQKNPYLYFLYSPQLNEYSSEDSTKIFNKLREYQELFIKTPFSNEKESHYRICALMGILADCNYKTLKSSMSVVKSKCDSIPSKDDIELFKSIFNNFKSNPERGKEFLFIFNILLANITNNTICAQSINICKLFNNLYHNFYENKDNEAFLKRFQVIYRMFSADISNNYSNLIAYNLDRDGKGAYKPAKNRFISYFFSRNLLGKSNTLNELKNKNSQSVLIHFMPEGDNTTSDINFSSIFDQICRRENITPGASTSEKIIKKTLNSEKIYLRNVCSVGGYVEFNEGEINNSLLSSQQRKLNDSEIQSQNQVMIRGKKLEKLEKYLNEGLQGVKEDKNLKISETAKFEVTEKYDGTIQISYFAKENNESYSMTLTKTEDGKQVPIKLKDFNFNEEVRVGLPNKEQSKDISLYFNQSYILTDEEKDDCWKNLATSMIVNNKQSITLPNNKVNDIKYVILNSKGEAKVKTLSATFDDETTKYSYEARLQAITNQLEEGEKILLYYDADKEKYNESLYESILLDEKKQERKYFCVYDETKHGKQLYTISKGNITPQKLEEKALNHFKEGVVQERENLVKIDEELLTNKDIMCNKKFYGDNNYDEPTAYIVHNIKNNNLEFALAPRESYYCNIDNECFIAMDKKHKYAAEPKKQNIGEFISHNILQSLSTAKKEIKFGKEKQTYGFDVSQLKNLPDPDQVALNKFNAIKGKIKQLYEKYGISLSAPEPLLSNEKIKKVQTELEKLQKALDSMSSQNVQDEQIPLNPPINPAPQTPRELDQPAEKPEEKPAEKPEEKPEEKPAEKPAEKPTPEKPAEKPTPEKPAEKPEEYNEEEVLKKMESFQEKLQEYSEYQTKIINIKGNIEQILGSRNNNLIELSEDIENDIMNSNAIQDSIQQTNILDTLEQLSNKLTESENKFQNIKNNYLKNNEALQQYEAEISKLFNVYMDNNNYDNVNINIIDQLQDKISNYITTCVKIEEQEKQLRDDDDEKDKINDITIELLKVDDQIKSCTTQLETDPLFVVLSQFNNSALQQNENKNTYLLSNCSSILQDDGNIAYSFKIKDNLEQDLGDVILNIDYDKNTINGFTYHSNLNYNTTYNYQFNEPTSIDKLISEQKENSDQQSIENKEIAKLAVLLNSNLYKCTEIDQRKYKIRNCFYNKNSGVSLNFVSLGNSKEEDEKNIKLTYHNFNMESSKVEVLLCDENNKPLTIKNFDSSKKIKMIDYQDKSYVGEFSFNNKEHDYNKILEEYSYKKRKSIENEVTRFNNRETNYRNVVHRNNDIGQSYIKKQKENEKDNLNTVCATLSTMSAITAFIIISFATPLGIGIGIASAFSALGLGGIVRGLLGLGLRDKPKSHESYHSSGSSTSLDNRRINIEKKYNTQNNRYNANSKNLTAFGGVKSNNNSNNMPLNNLKDKDNKQQMSN